MRPLNIDSNPIGTAETGGRFRSHLVNGFALRRRSAPFWVGARGVA